MKIPFIAYTSAAQSGEECVGRYVMPCPMTPEHHVNTVVTALNQAQSILNDCKYDNDGSSSWHAVEGRSLTFFPSEIHINDSPDSKTILQRSWVKPTDRAPKTKSQAILALNDLRSFCSAISHNPEALAAQNKLYSEMKLLARNLWASARSILPAGIEIKLVDIALRPNSDRIRIVSTGDRSEWHDRLIYPSQEITQRVAKLPSVSCMEYIEQNNSYYFLAAHHRLDHLSVIEEMQTLSQIESPSRWVRRS